MNKLLTVILMIIILVILFATQPQPPQPETDDLGLPYRNDMQQFNQYPQ